MKKLIAVVLTVILLTAVLLPVDAASGPTSGQCGDNVYWSLSDGVLNIYGSGDMYGYTSSNQPWGVNRSYIQGIVVQENITSIGSYAFYFCTDATYISLPSTIKSIGKNSFSNCKSVRQICLPEGIKTLPDFAINKCTNLTLITIPRSVRSFGQNVFSDCTSLKSAIIPKGVTEISYGLFENCSSLEWVSIPKSVTNIKIGAFDECGSLSDIYYEGSSSQFGNISVAYLDSYNEGLKYAQRHYNTYRSFLDVPTYEWYYEPVEYVSDNSIMTGTQVNIFSPASALNRAQFAVVLYRLEGSPSVSYVSRFNDIQYGTWFTDAVIWASNVGVVKGYTNGSYGFADNITREQITLMMHRYANYKNGSTSGAVDISRFPDAYRVSDYAVDAFKWAYGNQIVTGKNNGTILDPLGFTNRCECATIIQRFINYNKTAPSASDYSENYKALRNYISKSTLVDSGNNKYIYWQNDTKTITMKISLNSGNLLFMASAEVQKELSYLEEVVYFQINENSNDFLSDFLVTYIMNFTGGTLPDDRLTLDKSKITKTSYYTRYKSDTNISSLLFTEMYNSTLQNALNMFDIYLYGNFGFGLKGLGFESYDGLE